MISSLLLFIELYITLDSYDYELKINEIMNKMVLINNNNNCFLSFQSL